MPSSSASSYLRRLDVRLTVYYTLILLFLFALLASFFLYRLQHNLIKQVDHLLRDECLELVQEITRAADVVRGCRQYTKDAVRRKYYPVYFRVLDASGVEIYTSDVTVKKKPRAVLAFPPPTGHDGEYFSFAVPGRSAFRCYQKKFPDKAHAAYVVQITTPTSRANKTVKNMLSNVVRAGPLVLVLSMVFGLYASRRPFAIIREINEITMSITSEHLSQRLPVPAAHTEVRDLTETINAMLDRLEKSFDEVVQFTSNVSHELRTPLAAIRGDMEVALSRERDAREYHEIMCTCLERISGLIDIVNSLLLLARFDAHKVRLHPEQVDCAEALKSMYDFFLPLAQEKHLDLRIERCDAVVAQADKTAIMRLLSNIIDNAIKFTPEHGTVALSLIRQPGAVECRVKDTGIGIPDGEIPRIFQRFYQVEQSRSGENPGSGLGLQICAKIVEAHHGTISVEHNDGGGVTFVIKLPLRE